MGLLSGLVSGFLGAEAADDASDAVSQANAQAIAEQRRQYDTTRADMAPWVNSGQSAVNQLSYLAGITPQGKNFEEFSAGVNRGMGGYGSIMKPFSMEDFNADPGYQFRLSEGQRALERSASAKGRLNSGGTLKALTQYGQDAASQEFDKAYGRYTANQNNIWNKLAGLSGSGQQQANTTAAAGQNSANNISGLMNNTGQAEAAGIIGKAKAIAGGVGAAEGGGLSQFLPSFF